MKNFKKYLSVSSEVQKSLEQNKAVVALESTIISHGMPYPENLNLAKDIEQLIRENGATPATIAIMNGKLKIGLCNSDLENLANSENIAKVSRRDIGQIIASKAVGATTVAATMIIAQLVGIKVFATGGIGGVHRGAGETFDISADLQEFSKTDVAVVCAGAKSILDIGLTLEYLETMGVPVVGYKTEEFPAFYCRSSGYGVDYKLDTPFEIANMLETKWEMGLSGGAVIANPVPEEYSLDPEYINGIIEESLSEAEKQGIKGKAITPFLLQQVKDRTDGKSLETNIKLAMNNARLASKIAFELSKL